ASRISRACRYGVISSWLRTSSRSLSNCRWHLSRRSPVDSSNVMKIHSPPVEAPSDHACGPVTRAKGPRPLAGTLGARGRGAGRDGPGDQARPGALQPLDQDSDEAAGEIGAEERVGGAPRPDGERV